MVFYESTALVINTSTSNRDEGQIFCVAIWDLIIAVFSLTSFPLLDYVTWVAARRLSIMPSESK